jgi:hypothetical protein
VRRHGNETRRGMTLVEALIATTIMTAIAGSIGLVVRSTSSAMSAVTVSVHEEARARRGMNRVKELLRGSARSTIAPQPNHPAWDTWVEFQRVSGQVNGVPTFEPLERIALRVDPTDPVDGVDNDGDHLIDEGELVWTRGIGSPEQTSFVLVRGVANRFELEQLNGVDDNANGLIDEQGVCFTYSDNTVTVRITIEQASREGAVTRASYESTISLLDS